jgi:IS30 family transposase
MKRENKKLSFDERVILYKLHKLHYSNRAIAIELGCHHKTVGEELKRNAKFIPPHSDYITQARATDDAFRARRKHASVRMRLKSSAIRSYVELHLKHARWSPQVIAGKLTTLGYCISAEAIYQWIQTERHDLKQCLWVAGKSKRRRRCGKQHRKLKAPAAPKTSIELLPQAARERTEIGHFELDALHGKQGSSVMQVKVDRKSRKLFVDLVPSLEAETYSQALIARMQQSVKAGVLKTILQDNGVEHAAHPHVDASLKTQSYFCHPYCASERGTVENRNKLLRRYLPKGQDFSELPREFIDYIEQQVNSTPMKVLNYKTPDQVWEEELRLAA